MKNIAELGKKVTIAVVPIIAKFIVEKALKK